MAIARFDRESPQYARIRQELQAAEISLRDQREKVAELRRSLPRDQAVGDLEFEELRDGEVRPIRLSALFDAPAKPLLLMHFMYGKKQTAPCPMCTMWADGYNGVMAHLSRHMNFAVLIAADLPGFMSFAEARGWSRLRVVSAANSGLKTRLGFETTEGAQIPGLSVFERAADGSLTHFYSQSALLGEAGGRGMDLLSPVWNYMDLIPAGRGDWYPSLTYQD